MVQGKLTVPQFQGDELTNPQVVALLPKIFVQEGSEQTRGRPPLRGAAIDCTLKNGEVIRLVSKNAKGSPTTPLTGDSLRMKFDSLVEPIVGSAGADALYAAIRALPSAPISTRSPPRYARRGSPRLQRRPMPERSVLAAARP